MDLSKTLLLGFIAGVTIVIGLPDRPLRAADAVAAAVPQRHRRRRPAVPGLGRLSAAWEPVDSALGAVHDHTGGLGPVFGYGALFAGGLAVGLLSPGRLRAVHVAE